jgi:hypothetical protein
MDDIDFGVDLDACWENFCKPQQLIQPVGTITILE